MSDVAPPLHDLEPAGEFRTFSDWVNTAKRRIAGKHAICFDAKGRHCAWGAHFMRARDEDAFPVRYWVPDEVVREPAAPAESLPVILSRPDVGAPPAPAASWPFPWRKPMSHYDSDGPGRLVEFDISGTRFRVLPSGDIGPHSGRDRYLVVCLTCEGEVLHKNTTGPSSRIEYHLRECHAVE